MAATKRKRRHPAARARRVTLALSLGATAVLTGVAAVRHHPASVATTVASAASSAGYGAASQAADQSAAAPVTSSHAS